MMIIIIIKITMSIANCLAQPKVGEGEIVIHGEDE